MELFHLRSAGSFAIGHAAQRLGQNIEDIKDLILNKKFITFSSDDATNVYEEYPPRDGYESQIHLNVIIRAILIHPELVS